MEWNEFIDNEKKKEYFEKLMQFVDEEYKSHRCFPDYNLIFNAFNLTPLNDLKVVILGQDPYHEPGQAHGLAFSVLCDKLPPTLKNIYKEIEADLNVKLNQNGDLTYLAKEGVLLLNTVLTVREGEAYSHKNKGWEIFTDNVIRKLNEREKPMVFLLWGANAQTKTSYITNPAHLILKAPHPSPLSAYRGFFGCHHFSKANEFLVANGMEPIDWQIR